MIRRFILRYGHHGGRVLFWALVFTVAPFAMTKAAWWQAELLALGICVLTIFAVAVDRRVASAAATAARTKARLAIAECVASVEGAPDLDDFSLADDVMLALRNAGLKLVAQR